MAILKSPDYHFILSNRNKNGKRLIMVNFSYGYFEINNNKKKYKVLKLSTKQSIEPLYWGDGKANRKYVSKFGTTLNNTLDIITTKLVNELQNFRTLYERNPTPKELKKSYNGEAEYITKTSIVDFSKNLVEQKAKLPIGNKAHIGNTAKNQYLRLIDFLEKYQTENEIELYFEEFTSDTYWNVINFIKEFGVKTRGKEYKTNYMSALSRKIITIFGQAKEQQIETKFSTKDKRISEVKSKTEIYLEDEEIQKIINDTPKNSSDKIARNFLIISSFTGMRINNIIQCKGIKPIEYSKDDTTFLGMTTPIISKTLNAQIIIPVLNPVKKILEEHDMCFPEFPTEQTTRKHIKAYLAKLEINTLVTITSRNYGSEKPKTEEAEKHKAFTPHDCRRTFITKMRQLGIRDSIIEKISHPTDSKLTEMMARYDKSTRIDNAYYFLKALTEKEHSLYNA